jgi:ABC-2 type transport system ATP-binding protein
MDEAEYCDRIAIMDKGVIVVLDTPDALKASIGHDRITLQTDDDQAAIAALQERFQIAGQISEGTVIFGVASGELFVPRLFAGLGVPIRSVSVSRPSLDDVFMSYTGTTIRDAEVSSSEQARAATMAFRRSR